MSEEPIEDYLDSVMSRLTSDPRAARRMLTEIESHLRESAAAHEATGLSRVEAERQAVSDFGEPAVIATGLGRLDWRDLLRPGALVAAVGCLGIAVSGLVAEAMYRIWGAEFVAGDLPGTAYTPSRCDYFQEYFPSSSCLHSAALHHTGEVVQYRVAMGVLGLLLLAMWRFLPPRRGLPVGYVPAAGALVFGAAALVLGIETLSAQRGHWTGAGQWSSAALVAGLIAAGYAVCFLRATRPSPVRRS